MLTGIFSLVAAMAGFIVSLLVFGRVYKRETAKYEREMAELDRELDLHPRWEIKVTSPDHDSPLVHVDTEALYYVWKYGGRSNDGYVDLLEMPRLHLWMKPAGWAEPDRTAALDGTGVLPDRMQPGRLWTSAG